MKKAKISQKQTSQNAPGDEIADEAVRAYHMPVIKIGTYKLGEPISIMSSFYAESLGATDEEIDAASQPGKCLVVNGQKWGISMKLKVSAVTKHPKNKS